MLSQTIDANTESQLEEFLETENIAGIAFYKRGQFHSKSLRGEQFIVFGTNEVNDLCLSLSNGKIYLIDKDNTQFVNSSLSLFVQCLKKHRELIQIEEKDEDRKYYYVGKELEKFISRIDPPALVGESFWVMIVEELAIGYEDTKAA